MQGERHRAEPGRRQDQSPLESPSSAVPCGGHLPQMTCKAEARDIGHCAFAAPPRIADAGPRGRDMERMAPAHASPVRRWAPGGMAKDAISAARITPVPSGFVRGGGHRRDGRPVSSPTRPAARPSR